MIAGEKAMHLAPDGKEGREYNAEEIYQMLIHQNHTNGISQMQTAQNNANKSSQMQTDNEGFEKSSIYQHEIWQGILDKTQHQDN